MQEDNNLRMTQEQFDALKNVLSKFGMDSTLKSFEDEVKLSASWKDELTIGAKSKKYESR